MPDAPRATFAPFSMSDVLCLQLVILPCIWRFARGRDVWFEERNLHKKPYNVVEELDCSARPLFPHSRLVPPMNNLISFPLVSCVCRNYHHIPIIHSSSLHTSVRDLSALHFCIYTSAI
ncbi:hypothetical protein CPB84DRAFT_1091117 [Gymnopilus junonius]|uniref:Uncharacterized protein n=1 Tax=Gymnopilus junonius TaxID=109634 RepID=A0A9P5TTI8_GYMJU|nr:hypothetical protein CPB84DRAFT_1091117 [Gymnopilus junonius]